jgi:predicted MFS family arabinose efflux permease
MTQLAPPDRTAGESRALPVGLLSLLAAATFAAVTTEVLPVGLLPPISHSLGVTESRTGLLVSGYAAVVAIASIPMTALLERLPRRGVLAAILATYAASNAVFAASGSYAVALAARLAGGLAHAAFFTVVISAAVALAPRSRSGRAVAIVGAGVALALAAGVPAGTALGTAFGWRWVFAGSAAALLALAAAAATLLPRTPPLAASHQTVGTALRQRSLLAVAAVVALLTLGQYTPFTYISPLLLHAGVTSGGVSAVLLGYGAAGIIGLALAGAVADRHPRAALRLVIALLAACLAVLGLGHATALTVLTVIVWGLLFGAVPTLAQAGALRAAPDAPDAAPAVVNAMFNVGIAGGSLIGARELAAGPPPALAVTGALLVTAALLVQAGPAARRLPGRRRAGRAASR